ncbi:MAG TPA: PIN domain-containing protein [Candidatus Sulfotelmatobacter sp.]|nr:PIN domain-containing protein [Candidatus Sulfotelmatobacter sp.]
MILLDTNVVIDARDASQPDHAWAAGLIESAATSEGAGINSVTLAELCSGSPMPEDIAPEIQKLGIEIFDLPAAGSTVCGKAYRRYLLARRASGGSGAPRIPLPDFFIGAHAEIMGWKLATRDTERITRYFPKVKLVTPKK